MNAPHIMLIEDDADSADALTLLLQAHGIQVEWAASGDEAIARFEVDPDRRLDAIVLDLMLPDMPGSELVRRLARLAPLPPIIIHSAAAPAAARDAAQATGAAEVLRKPVEWSDMRQALQRCGIHPTMSGAPGEDGSGSRG